MPFEHYCHCGKWGAFGTGVSLLKGQEGTWYCAEHRPNRQPAPVPPEKPAPAPTEEFDADLFAPPPAKKPSPKKHRIIKRKNYDLLELETDGLPPGNQIKSSPKS